MLRQLSSALPTLSSFTGSSQKLPADHHDPNRAKAYVELASDLRAANIPVDESDCYTCDLPCADQSQGTVAEAWDGKTYSQYVEDRYGDLGSLPNGFDTDWESELAGSGNPPEGRLVVVSTGKSDWVRDHTDEKDGFSYQLYEYIKTLPSPPTPKGGGKFDPNAKKPVSTYITETPLVTPTKALPSLYSSSLISQSDDLEDQSVIVFPDWKVVHEVENSKEGAEGLFGAALNGGLGRAGRFLPDVEGVDRRRSWVLPYRAVVLLCSHKRRDKRCHIAAPLLRHALITVLRKYDVSIDETGSSLSHLHGPPLEEVSGTEEERELEVEKRLESIEGIKGGNGGEVGIFNINHLGGHRYAGVMLILFPSGAYLSYGRIIPQEVPRIVEETILKGKVVPGLLRNATGVARGKREGKRCGEGFLGW